MFVPLVSLSLTLGQQFYIILKSSIGLSNSPVTSFYSVDEDSVPHLFVDPVLNVKPKHALGIHIFY